MWHKIFYPAKFFWQYFLSDWEFLNKILLACWTFIYMQNYQMFVQLSLTITKLCHIRCDHLVNCYMSLEKPFLRNVAIFLQQYDWCTHIWHDDAEHMSLKCIPVKNFNFKNPKWWTTDTLEWPVLQHHEILQFFDFQDGGCPPSWIFEIEI